MGKIPWRRDWLFTPVFLSEEFHGERSLVGFSPWGHKESDVTELLTTCGQVMVILSACVGREISTGRIRNVHGSHKESDKTWRLNNNSNNKREQIKGLLRCLSVWSDIPVSHRNLCIAVTLIHRVSIFPIISNKEVFLILGMTIPQRELFFLLFIFFFFFKSTTTNLFLTGS